VIAWFRAWRGRRRYARVYARHLALADTHLPGAPPHKVDAWARHHTDRELAQ
jgi:hypothetical protein